MGKSSADDLLARLAEMGIRTGKSPGAAGDASGGASAPAASSASRESAAGPAVGDAPEAGKESDARLEKLLKRISALTGDPGVLKNDAPEESSRPSPRGEPPPQTTPPTPKAVLTSPLTPASEQPAQLPTSAFFPREPESLHVAGLTEGQLEALVLKYLLAVGTATGRSVANQVKLPFKLIDEMMARMKNDQLVVYYGSAPMNDYVYQLTDMGRERARRHSEHSTYFGSAPVTLRDYIDSVKAQSLTTQHPTRRDLEAAFQDLLINKRMLERLGPAINSGRGLFLYGAPGNGKTSIAERVTSAFGSLIWIPRAIAVDGEIMRLFDPSNHEEAPLEASEGLLHRDQIDHRWVRIKRPTIVVGGELTMDNLEVTLNKSTGVSESPLQLKSNCGTLVIDDFGRQKMGTDQLLNRWIVPLEKRYYFLNLPSGKKIQVPFDQLIVFSTNLEPRDLVDDAFLRRIPYKIQVVDPTEEEFCELLKVMAGKFGMEFRPDVASYLVEKHYKAVNRPFRCCQPRDLLLQIRNYCYFNDVKPEMTRENFDFAVENYFAVM